MNTRKVITRTAAGWLQRLQPYVSEWDTATTRLWVEPLGFDITLDMSGTRLFIVRHSNPDVIPAPTAWDTYPSYDTSASRQHAVIFHFLSLIHLTGTCFDIYIYLILFISIVRLI